MQMVEYVGPSEEEMNSRRRELELQMEKVLAMPESKKRTEILKKLKAQLAQLKRRGGMSGQQRVANAMAYKKANPETEEQKQRAEEARRNQPGFIRGGFAMAKRSSDSDYYNAQPLSTYDALTSVMEANQVMSEYGQPSRGFSSARPARQMSMGAMTPMDYGQAPMVSFTPMQSGGPFKADVGGRRKSGRKPSKRGEIVKKVMRERGLSLPQASKYVKEKGLY
jgi:hypothetical protein